MSAVGHGWDMADLRILLLSDGRPGHFHLSEGVVAAIERRRAVDCTRLRIDRKKLIPGRTLRRIADVRWWVPKTLFKLGYLDLEARAIADNLFWAICRRIEKVISGLEYVPEDLEGLERALADTYYCNFSVFQSVPDHWAVKQLFPVMPIHRLNEQPMRRAILADLTCDSDGKVDRFIDLRDVKHTLELHDYKAGQPYYLGMFLVGAYQEILGDLHNLFGDTNAIHVALDERHGYRIERVVEGDTVTEVLSYVQYDRQELMKRMRMVTEAALRRGDINLEESALLRRKYEDSLSGYTYLSREQGKADRRDAAGQPPLTEETFQGEV